VHVVRNAVIDGPRRRSRGLVGRSVWRRPTVVVPTSVVRNEIVKLWVHTSAFMGCRFKKECPYACKTSPSGRRRRPAPRDARGTSSGSCHATPESSNPSVIRTKAEMTALSRNLSNESEFSAPGVSRPAIQLRIDREPEPRRLVITKQRLQQDPRRPRRGPHERMPRRDHAGIAPARLARHGVLALERHDLVPIPATDRPWSRRPHRHP
jgi:hypothetical protein